MTQQQQTQKSETLWQKLFGKKKEDKTATTQQQKQQKTQQKTQQQKQQQTQQKTQKQQQKQQQQQTQKQQQQQTQKQQQQQTQKQQQQQQLKQQQKQQLLQQHLGPKKTQVSQSLQDGMEEVEQQAVDAQQLAQQDVQQAQSNYGLAQMQQTKAEKTLGRQIQQSDGDLNEKTLQQAYDTHVAQKNTQKAKRSLQQAVKKSQQIDGILDEIRNLRQEAVANLSRQKMKRQSTTSYDFNADPNNEFLHIKRPNQQITYGRKNSPDGKRYNNIPRMVFPKQVFTPSTETTEYMD
jgi:hypothetical protein